MKNEKAQPARVCANCIHFLACQKWAGIQMLDNGAKNCDIFDTIQSSVAYFFGYIDGIDAARRVNNES